MASDGPDRQTMGEPRLIVHLTDEGDITPLRFMAHMEAGHQILYEGGDLTQEPWWPQVNDRVMDILRDREPF